MTAWDPRLYLQFGSERTQPSIDLAARVALENPAWIVDLGCGPGNSTRVLHARWPDARIAGLDSSESMIAEARASAPEHEWVVGDITAWEPARDYDLIFSNAALQWVPDHGEVFTRLMRFLRASCVLAVQMPCHYNSPLHRAVQEVSRRGEWNERLAGARGALAGQPSGFYYDLLGPLCSRLDLWETEYIHVMEGPQAIVDWIRGTGLRPYLEGLESDEEREAFEGQLLQEYTEAYPRQGDGKVLLPFRRQFILAVK